MKASTSGGRVWTSVSVNCLVGTACRRVVVVRPKVDKEQPVAACIGTYEPRLHQNRVNISAISLGAEDMTYVALWPRNRWACPCHSVTGPGERACRRGGGDPRHLQLHLAGIRAWCNICVEGDASWSNLL